MKPESIIVAALRGAAAAVEKLCAEPTADPAPCPHGCTEDGHPQCPVHGSAPLPAYGPSSVDSSSPPREPAAGATLSDPEACSCDESERLHGYMKDITFLHRQWSDQKALAGNVLTRIGDVVLRWMSNLP